jgi:hypothetical protein
MLVVLTYADKKRTGFGLEKTQKKLRLSLNSSRQLAAALSSTLGNDSKEGASRGSQAKSLDALIEEYRKASERSPMVHKECVSNTGSSLAVQQKRAIPFTILGGKPAIECEGFDSAREMRIISGAQFPANMADGLHESPQHHKLIREDTKQHSAVTVHSSLSNGGSSQHLGADKSSEQGTELDVTFLCQLFPNAHTQHHAIKAIQPAKKIQGKSMPVFWTCCFFQLLTITKAKAI